MTEFRIKPFKFAPVILVLIHYLTGYAQPNMVGLGKANVFKGGMVSIPLKAGFRLGLSSAQGTIFYNPNIVQALEIANIHTGFNADTGSFNLKISGKICFSLDNNSPIELGPEDALFEIIFKAIGKVTDSSALELASEPTELEFSGNLHDTLKPELENGWIKIVPPPVNPDSIQIRNGFSPNTDGVNDNWVIFDGFRQFNNMEIQVYNSNGDRVFHSYGPYTPWDGGTNGKSNPPGSYWYVIDINKGLGPVYKGLLEIAR